MKIERKYLPSKKFTVSLSFAIMLVLIAVALGYSQHTNSAYKNTNGIIVDLNATSTLNGVNGGNYQIDPSILAMDQKAQAELQSLTPTDKLSRDLISNIIATQPTNGPMDQMTTDVLVKKAIAEIPQKYFTGITKESDLNIIPIHDDTFGKDIATYAYNYFLQIQSFSKISGQDFTLINNSIYNATPFPKNELAVIVSKYQSIINNMVKIPLPALSGSSLTTDHLAIINDLEILIKIDNDIINSNGDNLNVFSDLSLYNDAMSDMAIAMDDISSAFNLNNQ